MAFSRRIWIRASRKKKLSLVCLPLSQFPQDRTEKTEPEVECRERKLVDVRSLLVDGAICELQNKS